MSTTTTATTATTNTDTQFRILYTTPFMAAANQRIETYIYADTEEEAMAEFRSRWTPTEWPEVKIFRVMMA